ncbi:MAG: hypothetical protein MN733_00065 [Nitrososphaera sp.]|nr:hypothetical protein [Nitrososphaera sp.]
MTDITLEVRKLGDKWRVIMDGDLVITGPYDSEEEALECFDDIVDSFEEGHGELIMRSAIGLDCFD